MANERTPAPVSVLFVCLGNICRSTMAEGVFHSLCSSSQQYGALIDEIDSAGTGAYHTGDSPDYRTMATLKQHNITNYNHAARKVNKDDFRRFDYILAMDEYNLKDLLRLRDNIISQSARTKAHTNTISTECTTPKIAEVRLFGDFNPDGTVNKKVGGGQEIEDPYYGGINGFEIAYEQAMKFSKGFLVYLERKQQQS
ncbi:low molecular weight phosphotyrosine protein phosphatase, putative [Talaromyces stipitatus ATCC 10500]|uniref:Low molecular weight phosphotyrosine protein phosphatase, putative n=1 Tax=Talaromyces stipitatus (strain ATCC 10500 / CBS 375.48 / QM 6759 / NRRL 1006) TaxID=441959 RepID=B8MB74_TALSN|nr:low molecular weight phosphotyrosine protein phosphatase, putative [Talaromyces stipitatus ATCC 10500]EED18863.1 low molecular weight phosphotyrosine protein phosphatase, putative [Talaromyces stipitatus ATCC 10500]